MNSSRASWQKRNWVWAHREKENGCVHVEERKTGNAEGRQVEDVGSCQEKLTAACWWLTHGAASHPHTKHFRDVLICLIFIAKRTQKVINQSGTLFFTSTCKSSTFVQTRVWTKQLQNIHFIFNLHICFNHLLYYSSIHTFSIFSYSVLRAAGWLVVIPQKSGTVFMCEHTWRRFIRLCTWPVTLYMKGEHLKEIHADTTILFAYNNIPWNLWCRVSDPLDTFSYQQMSSISPFWTCLLLSHCIHN